MKTMNRMNQIGALLALSTTISFAAAYRDEARAHWAFQPVKKPAAPSVKLAGWVKAPVDAFILAQLEAKGMKPSPPASRETLLRRVAFDLIGLPPTTDELRAFLADNSPNAFATVVDRLLRSQQHLRLLPSHLQVDRKSTRLNSSHPRLSRMPSSA